MPDVEFSLQRARQAKEAAKALLGDLPNVAGIGLGRQDTEFLVQVNLHQAPEPRDSFPEEVQGVKVRYRVVGEIHTQPVGSCS